MAGKFNFDQIIDRREVPALKTHRNVLGEDGMGLFPAGVADMDFPIPEPISKALAQRLAHGIFGYEAMPDGLIPALIAWVKERHNWQINPDHILRAPNVLNSLSMAVNLFTEPDDLIIIQPPVFFDFADIISENNRRCAENPLILSNGRYQLDFDGLQTCAEDPRTKLLFLCNPHNPVGRVWTKAELLKLGAICRANGVIVVSDEIHGDITFQGHSYTPFASISKADAKNSIICLSPAKSFNIASCSAAFTIIANPEHINAFKAENSRLNVNKNNAFAGVAMETAYKKGGEWLDAAIDYITGNLALLRSEFADIPEVTLIEPEGTFLVWLDFRNMGLQADELQTFLRHQANLSLTRGIAFGETGNGFARMNIACPRSRLKQMLDSLKTAITNNREHN